MCRCGIFAAHAYDPKDLPAFRARAVALSKRLRHRGPDWSGCKMTQDAILVHERLAIVGVGELHTHKDFLRPAEGLGRAHSPGGSLTSSNPR